MTDRKQTLVLGGTGQLGSALVGRLKAHGESVQAPGRDEWDLRDVDNIELQIESHAPSLVINTAAFNNVAAAATAEGEIEARWLNVEFPRRLAMACHARGVLLVHVSTDYVFDGRSKRPYVETDATNPLQAYGLSKRDGESAVLEVAPTSLVVRTSTLFGPSRRSHKNFVTLVLENARRDGKVEMARGPISSPTYAPDLADAICLLIDRNVRGIVHVANSDTCTRYEFAEGILRAAGLRESTELVLREAVLDGVPRPEYSVLDSGRLSSKTGYSPRPWTAALAEYLARAE